MTDIVSPRRRSEMMAGIRGTDTRPERIVRKTLHALGLRFRLHAKDLPGRPDVVLPRHRTVVFVHGCYWHRHPGCRYATTPGSNIEFWQRKFAENTARDARNQEQLLALGWRVLVVWECATRDATTLADSLRQQFPLLPPTIPTTHP